METFALLAMQMETAQSIRKFLGKIASVHSTTLATIPVQEIIMMEHTIAAAHRHITTTATAKHALARVVKHATHST
jgi:hypothetical protein